MSIHLQAKTKTSENFIGLVLAVHCTRPGLTIYSGDYPVTLASTVIQLHLVQWRGYSRSGATWEDADKIKV